MDFSCIFPLFSSSQFFHLYSGTGRWGKRRLAIQSCNAGRQTALYSSTFLLVSGGYMCLSYSWDSLSNGKDNLDSFRESVVCIPPLLPSVLVSHSHLPFSRDKFLKGIIKLIQYAILLLNLFRRFQD